MVILGGFRPPVTVPSARRFVVPLEAGLAAEEQRAGAATRP